MRSGGDWAPAMPGSNTLSKTGIATRTRMFTTRMFMTRILMTRILMTRIPMTRILMMSLARWGRARLSASAILTGCIWVAPNGCDEAMGVAPVELPEQAPRASSPSKLPEQAERHGKFSPRMAACSAALATATLAFRVA